MTIIKIHGFLSKEFGAKIKMNLGSLNNVISAIDCIRNGFRKRIIELQSQGYNFSIQKIKNEIHITPLIHGSGKTLMYIIAVVLIVVGVILMFIPGFQALGFQLIMAGLQIGIQTAMMPKMKFPDMQQQQVGGATYSSESDGKSYVFSNSNNLAVQGANIQLGYGQIKIGSQLLSVSVKSYKTSETFEKENYFINTQPESSTFSAENDQNSTNINLL